MRLLTGRLSVPDLQLASRRRSLFATSLHTWSYKTEVKGQTANQSSTFNLCELLLRGILQNKKKFSGRFYKTSFKVYLKKKNSMFDGFKLTLTVGLQASSAWFNTNITPSTSGSASEWLLSLSLWLLSGPRKGPLPFCVVLQPRGGRANARGRAAVNSGVLFSRLEAIYCHACYT